MILSKDNEFCEGQERADVLLDTADKPLATWHARSWACKKSEPHTPLPAEGLSSAPSDGGRQADRERHNERELGKIREVRDPKTAAHTQKGI